jgi:hypothetical protein
MGDSVLLLVTIVLVLIAAVTLLIGIFGDSLALIFVSIGSSVLAAVVLGVVSQMTKRRPAEATAGGPAPLATAPATEPATERIGAPEPVGASTSVMETVSTVADAAGGALPIAGYDSLRVNEILPKLSSLDLDELETVAQHEESTKNRTSVLNKIDELMDALEAEGAPVAAPAATVADVGERAFPIADYDALDADEVVGLLADLDADELEEIAEYEETHANRDAVLDAIDDRLDELEGVAPAASRVATAVKITGKKATAKKAGAKKASTAKKTTAAKKATAKKAASRPPAKKAAAAARTTATAAKKATAKKATAKKATAKKATAKKVATKKAAKKTARR